MAIISLLTTASSPAIIPAYTRRCFAPLHCEGSWLTFPLQYGSFIWSTLMAAVLEAAAAAAVKTVEPIHRWGASYCDSKPPNCSFEVITRQVSAISSTMPETNGGGRACMMESDSWGLLAVCWVKRKAVAWLGINLQWTSGKTRLFLQHLHRLYFAFYFIFPHTIHLAYYFRTYSLSKLKL